MDDKYESDVREYWRLDFVRADEPSSCDYFRHHRRHQMVLAIGQRTCPFDPRAKKDTELVKKTKIYLQHEQHPCYETGGHTNSLTNDAPSS